MDLTLETIFLADDDLFAGDSKFSKLTNENGMYVYWHEIFELNDVKKVLQNYSIWRNFPFSTITILKKFAILQNYSIL